MRCINITLRLDYQIVCGLRLIPKCTFHFSEDLSTGYKNLHHGKGEDPHQHRRHWPRRLWQVYHHWTPDLQGVLATFSDVETFSDDNYQSLHD